jgi:excisionase family DNA binding protein
MSKKYYTTYQISKICSVYISTVIDWIEAGKLQAHRTPGGHRRVLKEDLVKFLTKYNMPIPEELQAVQHKRILIVDNSKESVALITDLIKTEEPNYQINSVETGVMAKTVIPEFDPDLVISEIQLPDSNGIDLLKYIKENRITTEVILIAESPSIKSVVEAMRLGSYDYLVKPFEKTNLLSAVKKCFERQSAIEEPTKLKGLYALYEVSKAMSSIMDFDNLLDLITKLVYETFEADGVSIMLLVEGPDGMQELEVKSVAGKTKHDHVGKKIKVGERIAGKTAELNVPILITGDAAKDKRFTDIKKYDDIKSSMSVPMVVKSKLIGVINVKIITSGTKYTEDDLRLLTVFASDAAIAIENAKIFIQLSKHTEELEKLLKESKELHL